MRRRGVAVTASTPTGRTKIAAASRLCAIFWPLRRFVSFQALMPACKSLRHFAPSAPDFCSRCIAPRQNVLKTTFLNRQALYLRPDPARVIVRPFKPATEPRDLNPTDKTRANHIVSRVLALDAETVVNQLEDVLENFEGRHRNLLATFEARADVMEQALAAHVT